MLRIVDLLLCGLLVLPIVRAETPNQSEAREARAKQAAERRMAYATSKAYNPYDREIREFEIEANKLLEADKWKEAIVTAEKGLKKNSCNIDLLIVMATAWRRLGDAEKADQIRDEWIGLVDSIIGSGTGRDPASAFKVISVSEEYTIIRVMDLIPVGQSLVHKDGSSFDVMKVKRRNAAGEFELYFNIDLPTKWLSADLAAPPKK
jgi:hypothetical protein